MDLIIKVSGAGSVSTTSNDVASIDMPQDGEIRGVLSHVRGSGIATGDRATAEISFLSTNQIGVNDARGSITEISQQTGDITTSGQADASNSFYQAFDPGIPVQGGERLHMHTSASTGVTPTGTFMLYITVGGTRRRSTRRR